MKKILIICIALFLNRNLKAQIRDSSHHYIGIGTGLGTVLFPFEFHVNYVLNYGKFIFKCDAGILPVTKYDPVLRLFPTFGIAEKSRDKITDYLGFGIGGALGNNSQNRLHGISPILNGGVFIPSTRSRKSVFGIDGSVGLFKVDRAYTSAGGYNGFEERRVLIAFLDFTVYF